MSHEYSAEPTPTEALRAARDLKIAAATELRFRVETVERNVETVATQVKQHGDRLTRAESSVQSIERIGGYIIKLLVSLLVTCLLGTVAAIYALFSHLITK
jgi:hypothetical protein